MMRTLIGVVAGLLLAAGVMLACGHAILQLHPMPPELQWQIPERLARWLAGAPEPALALLACAGGLASLVGGWAAARIASPHRGGAALAVAVPLMLAIVASIALLPQPAWVPIVGMLLPIPAAVAAWRLAVPRREI